ncbi:MAG: lysylphosphatidylglycerol synthase transmembrane domain-containing protein [Thermoguttaceae bacterium]
MLRRLKKTIYGLLRVAISLCIIAYLIHSATSGAGKENVFTIFWNQPKDWGMFACALVFITMGVLLTFVRWWYLACALDIPCRFADAIRIGFWGFLFNLAPLGIVGGDLVKALMLAHEQRDYRAKAVASVLFDRVLGLYLLFVVGTAAILLTGFWRTEVLELHNICIATFIATGLGALAIAMMLAPGKIVERLTRSLGKIPKIGPIIESLVTAVRMYRHKPLVVAIAMLMSAGVHCFLSVGIYFIARGLPGDVFSLSTYFIFWSLSTVTAVIPLPMGPFEFVLEFLYTHIPQAGVTIVKGQGLLIALVFRLINLVVAAMGIYYYFGGRREVSEVMHEDEDFLLENSALQE